jgi:hypothetical protein
MMNNKIIKGYYKAAPGAYFSDKDAVEYGAAIEKIMDANPGVSLIPDMVLDAAENKDSALHDYFEWDDSVCARRYRLKQAEEMICHLRYVVVTGGKNISQRAFIDVSVSPETGGGKEEFVHIRKVMNSPDLKEKALK